ncbi:alpha-1,4-glucan--maltose-1-phosphate maltosyltransferase [Aquihabitans sp. G128]|uniref:alpha-1,4-glucan--maltose-1-phosphate maltosyltransferase n=1 Tax=Aquihabitans sp. G128 TaxID=2849779 RepID=UPI001C2368E9|nr:alpha-1,4-glucan--maltose-1-phosphate maltosyltransferase [Aquihabitans sp. G128]QXC59775.1 alpha-1,4-glucan--maltose-1-phosphate maltosyltransferase [Aquihabitans sp. G128]
MRVERPRPDLDGGRYAPKRTVGDRVELSAEVLRDGHEVLRADLLVRPPKGSWTVHPMVNVDAETLGVRWAASVDLDRPGAWTWTVRAWADVLASWRHELHRKHDGGQDDLDSELAEGAQLLEACAARADDTDGPAIAEAAAAAADTTLPTAERVAIALHPALVDATDRHPDRSEASDLSPSRTVQVAPALARFGAWYELFPRSWGGLAGVRRRLPALAELGFDVLYLPPISPIGLTNRKGRNNTLVAGPDDPGSPWAIGDATGGHDAVHPELGTVEDLEGLVADARELGLEVALDLAIQCSADHPWLTEHPEWFQHRPDGTLKYAENPPKKYQDIYNVDFDCEDWPGLWSALRDVVLTWIDRGVRVFRVDNPHTKPLSFWEWLIAGVHKAHPEVVFLAEAFTYRAMMQELGRVGFDQGYTYFTWKQSAAELAEYVTELAGDERELFRPNFFVNTPDILTEQLQHGGPNTFVSRLVLAATLSPSYGVYSGFESFEHVAVKEGSEEYLDSEKFEARERSLDGPLLPLVAELNRIRRSQPALQHLAGTRVLATENEALLAYAKVAAGDTVLCVVLLDPDHAQEGVCIVPDDLGLPPTFEVEDRLTGERFRWQLGRNYVRLEPGSRPAHVLAVVGP